MNSVRVDDWTTECTNIASNNSRLKACTVFTDTVEFFLNRAELNSVNSGNLISH